MTSKKINPLLKHSLKKSSLERKNVNISGNNSFGSISDEIKESNVNTKKVKKSTNKKMTSQRLYNDTVEKVKLLSFFIPNDDNKGHKSFDDILNRLIEFHVDSILTDRQKDMYRQMCENNNLNWVCYALYISYATHAIYTMHTIEFLKNSKEVYDNSKGFETLLNENFKINNSGNFRNSY